MRPRREWANLLFTKVRFYTITTMWIYFHYLISPRSFITKCYLGQVKRHNTQWLVSQTCNKAAVLMEYICMVSNQDSLSVCLSLSRVRLYCKWHSDKTLSALIDIYCTWPDTCTGKIREKKKLFCIEVFFFSSFTTYTGVDLGVTPEQKVYKP